MTFTDLKSEIERETETLFNVRLQAFDDGLTYREFKLLIREAMVAGAQLGIKDAQKEMAEALAELSNKDRN